MESKETSNRHSSLKLRLTRWILLKLLEWLEKQSRSQLTLLWMTQELTQEKQNLFLLHMTEENKLTMMQVWEDLQLTLRIMISNLQEMQS